MFQPRLIYQSATVMFIQNKIYCYALQYYFANASLAVSLPQ